MTTERTLAVFPQPRTLVDMTRLMRALLGPVLTAATLAGCAAEVPPARLGEPVPLAKLDVIFVATDLTIVNAMLTLANVTRDDVVYDLGCGDGRIVIAAAKEFGARGVGVDLDPQRIREAQANAARAGVADRVTFRVQDVFDTDIQPATVVTLFLSPELNARLRPKLTSQLKPGSRIVSDRYGIADWMPSGPRPSRSAGPVTTSSCGACHDRVRLARSGRAAFERQAWGMRTSSSRPRIARRPSSPKTSSGSRSPRTWSAATRRAPTPGRGRTMRSWLAALPRARRGARSGSASPR